MQISIEYIVLPMFHGDVAVEYAPYPRGSDRNSDRSIRSDRIELHRIRGLGRAPHSTLPGAPWTRSAQPRHFSWFVAFRHSYTLLRLGLFIVWKAFHCVILPCARISFVWKLEPRDG